MSPLPYLVVPNTAVSSVLDLEEDRKHYLIYYMNMVMLDAETRYTQLEQLALALIEIVKKLKLYFQSYTVIVLTSYPLKMYCIVLIHQKSWGNGLLCFWQYDIGYQLCTIIKAHILAEFTTSNQHDKDSMLDWHLYINRSSNSRGKRIRIVIKTLTNKLFKRLVRLQLNQ